MEAIVDSGAATNIITKGLLEKLGMKITESSNAVFSNVNGKKVPSLGKVDIKIKIKDTEIPMKVQVIDSTKRDLILGTEILAEVKGKINFEKNELKIEYNGKEIRTPIFYNRKKLEVQEYQDFEDEFEEFEEEELEMMKTIRKNTKKRNLMKALLITQQNYHKKDQKKDES